MAAVAAVALVCVPQAALAQHGGGGHGGGGGGHFGGGGGGHFGGGGGGHFGGGSHGGSHESAPRSGTHSGGSPSGAPVRPGTPPISFEHGNPTITSRGASPSSFEHPGGPAAGFSASIGEPAPVSQHVTIGFPPAGGAEGFVAPVGPIHGGNGGVLSFSGQGHEIWQNRPDGGAVHQGGSSSFLESRPMESQRVGPFPPRRFHGGFFEPGYGYGYGFGAFYPWGFGLGLGFGPGCDPLWNFGCGAYGYTGYGYYGPYAPGFYLNSYSGDDIAAAPDTSQDYGVYSDQGTAADNSSDAGAKGTTVLYLNDGTSFAVTDYWVADYKLHYVTDGARENVIDLDQIDVQRTVDQNAARGVNFTLRPAPGSAQR